MPPRQFSSRDVIKVLDNANWQYANPGSGGSHVVMTKTDHDGHSYNVTIPLGNDPLAPGTLRNIATQIHVTGLIAGATIAIVHVPRLGSHAERSPW